MTSSLSDLREKEKEKIIYEKLLKEEEAKSTEEQVKKDFVKHHGQKRWLEVETIKLKIEKQEKEIENEFRKDLAEVRRVMYMCYALATVIAWYLTWGHKG